MSSASDELDQLRLAIDGHDRFWRSAALTDQALLGWLIRAWSPWYHGFRSFDEGGGALDERGDVRAGLLGDLSRTLGQFRQQAGARGFPLPPAPGDAEDERQGLRWNPWGTLRNIWHHEAPDRGATTQDARSGGESMYPLIGKKGGGGGGGGHHHGGRGRRQFFGGGGWGYQPDPWPPWWYYPQQGAQYAYDEEEDTVSGRGGGMRGGGSRLGKRRRRHRQQFGDPQQQEQQQGQGEPMPYFPQNGDPDSDEEPMTVSGDNELFALLPMLAPGAGGLSCDLHLGPDLQLQVEICVDGSCYQASADLSGVLGHVAEGVAAYHDRLHAGHRASASSPAAVADVSSKADAAVRAAGQMLVGALYDQHVNTITSGWLDGLKRAALFAASPVYAVHKQFGGTLKEYRGPITMAATAVASAYGGPAGGAAAGQLVGPMIDHLAEGRGAEFAEAIQQQAGADPTVARAVEDAQKAVAHTTAAYHLAKTAAKAAEGDDASAQKVAEVDQAASRGDLAAIQAMQIMAAVLQQVVANQQKSAETQAGREIRRKGSVGGGEQKRLRREASQAAKDARTQLGAKFLGVVKERGGQGANTSGRRVTLTESTYVEAFESFDQAEDWFFSVTMMEPASYLYAAYYDASNPVWPSAIQESFGRVDRPATTTSGLPLLPFALGALGGGALGIFTRDLAWKRDLRQAGMMDAQGHLLRGSAPVAPAPIPTVSGAGPLLPLLAFGAGGAAGWWGHEWWEGHKAHLAEAAAATAAQSAASQTPLASQVPPGVPPAASAAPATSSGWW